MLITRFIRNLIVLLFIALPLEIIGWFLLPIVLLFVPKTQLKLPDPFRFWDCADMYIGRDYSTYAAVCAQGYWARYTWLAWRNPANYFGYFYLSFIFKPSGQYTVIDPSQFNVGNTTGARAGYRHIEYVQDGNTYYEYCWIKKWSATKCTRIRFGWKIGDNKNPAGSYCQWVMAIQPWIEFNGV